MREGGKMKREKVLVVITKYLKAENLVKVSLALLPFNE